MSHDDPVRRTDRDSVFMVVPAYNEGPVIRATVVPLLDAGWTISESRFAHATEILGEIRRHKLRFREMPTNIRYTDYARSKGQFSWNALQILLELFLGRTSR